MPRRRNFNNYTVGREEVEPPENVDRWIAEDSISIGASRARSLDDEVLEEFGLPPAPDDDERAILGYEGRIDEGDEVPPSVAEDLYPGCPDKVTPVKAGKAAHPWLESDD